MKADRWESFDRGALIEALIALKTCPKCRRPLRVASDPADGLACVTCDEVYEVKP